MHSLAINAIITALIGCTAGVDVSMLLWISDGRPLVPLIVSPGTPATAVVASNRSTWFRAQLLPVGTEQLLPAGLVRHGPCVVVTADCRCYRWVTDVTGATLTQTDGLVITAQIPALLTSATLTVTAVLAEDVTLAGQYPPPMIMQALSSVVKSSMYSAHQAVAAARFYCDKASQRISGQMMADRTDLSDRVVTASITVEVEPPSGRPLSHPSSVNVILGLCATSVLSLVVAAGWTVAHIRSKPADKLL